MFKQMPQSTDSVYDWENLLLQLVWVTLGRTFYILGCEAMKQDAAHAASLYVWMKRLQTFGFILRFQSGTKPLF